MDFLPKKGRILIMYVEGGEGFYKGFVYTFDMVENDVGAGFVGNMSTEEVNASISGTIRRCSASINIRVTAYGTNFFLGPQIQWHC